MSFPTKEDIESVKVEKGVQTVTTDMLPSETVGNVILNCLSMYQPEEYDKKEMFEVFRLAEWVNKDNGEELDQKLMTFLTTKVLPKSVRVEKKNERTGAVEASGAYLMWVIGQVTQALGITE